MGMLTLLNAHRECWEKALLARPPNGAGWARAYMRAHNMCNFGDVDSERVSQRLSITPGPMRGDTLTRGLGTRRDGHSEHRQCVYRPHIQTCADKDCANASSITWFPGMSASAVCSPVLGGAQQNCRGKTDGGRCSFPLVYITTPQQELFMPAYRDRGVIKSPFSIARCCECACVTVPKIRMSL
jgi:hypothetical protein